MTLKAAVATFFVGLFDLWLISHFIAYQMCVWAGNGVCVAP